MLMSVERKRNVKENPKENKDVSRRALKKHMKEQEECKK